MKKTSLPFPDTQTRWRFWLNEGIRLTSFKKYTEAIDCFDKVLKIRPQFAEAWYQKGLTFSASGEDAKAMECYDQALNFNPQYEAAWNDKGLMLKKLGKNDNAIQCFNNILKISPNNLNTWGNKGICLVNLGEEAEAIKCFDRALKLNPNNNLTWRYKGISLANLNEKNEAIKCFDQALKLNPNNKNTWLEKGIALENLGKDVEAIECYGQALKIDLKFKEVWNEKGSVLSHRGKYSDAMKCYDQALQIDANHPNAWNGKAYILLYQMKFDEAEACLDKALSQNCHYSFALQGKGLIEYQKQNFELANEYFQKAEAHVSQVRKLDEFCELYYRRGRVFAGLNELNKAQEAFNKALAFSPNYAPAKQELKKLQSTHSKPDTLQQQPLEKLTKESHELDEELEKLRLEDEELEKKPKTYHKSTTNPSSQKIDSPPKTDKVETISSPSKISEKKLIAKPKSLSPPQEELAQLFQESPHESLQHLKKELQTLKQQLQNNAQYQSNLEQKVQSLQTASVKTSELANFKKDLADLKMQHAEIQAEREIKAARLAAEAKFKTQPNLWLFYRIMYIHVENRFLGAKDIASDFPKLGFTGTIGDVATGVNVVSKFLALIPAIGNSLDTAVSFGTAGLEKIDEERITNILKAIADLGTLTDIKRAAESTARQLTECYSDQLNQLSTDAKKPTSTLGKIKEGGKSLYEATKEFVVKEQASSSPKEVAEFAVSQIVSALLDLSIKPDQPLDAQFIQAVCAPPSRLEKIKHAVAGVIGSNEIETKDGKKWQLQDFYRKPGIRTASGECYAGEGAEPELYGYRSGTREEAESLNWQLVPSVKEVKRSDLSEVSKTAPKVLPRTLNSYASVNTQLQEQPTSPVAYKHEMEELREQLKAAEEARIKHENELRALKESQERENARREVELRTLQSKMSKLFQDQGDTDLSSDVDLGNQLQLKVQSQQTSQRSPRMGLSNTETSGKVVEHDQRISKLEQITALWMETSESVNTENEEEDSTRTELFSQHSTSKR